MSRTRTRIAEEGAWILPPEIASVQLESASVLTYQQTRPASDIVSSLSLGERWHCLPAARLQERRCGLAGPEGA